MDKKEALLILIKHTYLLTDNAKMVLLGKINMLSTEEIDTLGKFLAMEKKIAIEKNSEIITKLEATAKQFSAIMNTSK